jgi:hypothetical protein
MRNYLKNKQLLDVADISFGDKVASKLIEKALDIGTNLMQNLFFSSRSHH